MTFAVIEDGRCVNIVQAEAWYAKMKGFGDRRNNTGLGISTIMASGAMINHPR